MAQPSKEMKALLLECEEYGINEKHLKARTELILKTYQTKMYELMMEKEARGAGNLQEEVIEDLYVLRDFRIATDSGAFRKAVRTVSGLGYLDEIIRTAMQEMALKRSLGDLYYRILELKYGSREVEKDVFIANKVNLGHTKMSERKAEAMIAVGLEITVSTLPAATRELIAASKAYDYEKA